MTFAYHHIAYADFEVANPVSPEAVRTLLATTGLGLGDTAIDIGAGAGGVTVMLARQGLNVHAIERDPAMAAMITDRVAEAGMAERVQIIAQSSATALSVLPPVSLIVALGTTFAAPGARTPAEIFGRLAENLTSPGFILWGDLFWKGDPPLPLRQLVGTVGDYATDAGWREGAIAAGLTVVSAEITPQPVWDDFFAAADGSVRVWLEANPDDPPAAAIRTRADQIRATFDFGRPYLGFGLYLLRKS